MANVTFKQATVLKAFVASGTFLPSLFRERARVPAALTAHGKFSSAPVLKVTSPGISRSRRQLAGL
jgi:hypothetical protein